MEDWKKKYQDSLEIVRKLRDDWASTQNRAAKEIEEAFPELSESEEDKVKNALIACVNKIFEEYSVFEHTSKEQIIAWINKQKRIGWTEYDEKKYTELCIFVKCHVKDEITKKYLLEWIETLRPNSYLEDALYLKDAVLEKIKELDLNSIFSMKDSEDYRCGFEDALMKIRDYINSISKLDFKIGQSIVPKNHQESELTITSIKNGHYYSGDLDICSIEEQYKWELSKNQ